MRLFHIAQRHGPRANGVRPDVAASTDNDGESFIVDNRIYVLARLADLAMYMVLDMHKQAADRPAWSGRIRHAVGRNMAGRKEENVAGRHDCQ
jgi:hypothetical protein